MAKCEGVRVVQPGGVQMEAGSIVPSRGLLSQRVCDGEQRDQDTTRTRIQRTPARCHDETQGSGPMHTASYRAAPERGPGV